MKGKSSKLVVERQAEKLLAEWDDLRQQAIGIERRHERAIKKDREIYEAAIAPATERFNEKIAPLRARKAEIEAELETLLKSTVDEKGVAAVPQAQTDTAIAVLVESPAQREVEPQKFFNAVPEPERGPSFWECFKVKLKEGDKFLGAKLNELATFRRSHKISVRAK